jgi:hypothetical protein
MPYRPAKQGRTTMDHNRDDRGLEQQQGDAQRQQADQQNQQADRRQSEGVEEQGQDALSNGSVGGVDTGDLRPGRTGDGGAER